ncbi:hypothetical protein [Corynebacterium sphenisci]|uniref:hypothetical protein n=1 Tax=Corynebacterium sphenisci TaxID=191493 RepID=UPI000952BC82|nr:hypothetical protein [Corynebacterium sphenisci]
MGNREYDLTAPGNRGTVDVVSTRRERAAMSFGMVQGERDDRGRLRGRVALRPVPGAAGDPAVEVLWEGRRIGTLPGDRARAHWAELTRIVDSGFTPVARAVLDTGDVLAVARISLADPGTVVPRNTPPERPWALLPKGPKIQVTGEGEQFGRLRRYISPDGPALLLVSLHPVARGSRTPWTGVEVRLDGHRIGELGKTSAGRMLAAVRYYEGRGLIPVSRAVLTGSALAAEVHLECARAHELSAEDLEPDVYPIPRLRPLPGLAADDAEPAAAAPAPEPADPPAAAAEPDPVPEPEPEPEPPAAMAPQAPAAPAAAPAPAVGEATAAEELWPDPWPDPWLAAAPAPAPAPHGSTPLSPTGPAGGVGAGVPEAPAEPGLGVDALLWIVLGHALLVFLAGWFPVENAGTLIGSSLAGIGIGLPPAILLRLRTGDRRRIRAWREAEASRVRSLAMLGPDDELVARPLRVPYPTPETAPRHLGRWSLIALGLFFVGLVLIGSFAP